MAAETPTPLGAIQQLHDPLRNLDDQLQGPMEAYVSERKAHMDAIEAIRIEANAQINQHINSIKAAEKLLKEQSDPLVQAQIPFQTQVGIAVLEEANILEQASKLEKENVDAIFIPKSVLDEVAAQIPFYTWTQKLMQETMPSLGLDEAGGIYLSKEDGAFFEQDQVNQNRYASTFIITDEENRCELRFELDYTHHENSDELDEVPLELSVEFLFDEESIPEDFPVDLDEIGDAVELWSKHMYLHERLRLMFLFVHAANRVQSTSQLALGE